MSRVINEGKTMPELSVMERDKGDNKVKWDPNDPASVAVARAAFEEAKRRGYLAYKVDPKDKSKGDLLRTFDPQAGRIIMSPAPVGG